MSAGLLVSNSHTIDFIKRYLTDPKNSNDKRFAEQTLHNVESTHLPVFKDKLVLITQYDYYNFQNTDIFTSSVPVDTDELNGNHYTNLINQKKQSISVTNYLYFLKQQQLIHNQSIIPTINNVNHNSLLMAENLLQHIQSLVPTAEQEWKVFTDKKINNIKPKLQSNITNLAKYNKISHHWYTRKHKKQWAKGNAQALKNSINDYHKQIQHIKNHYNNRISLYHNIKQLGNKFSLNLYKKFTQTLLDSLSNTEYVDGKSYRYTPFDVKYQNKIVKVTLDDFNSKNKQIGKPVIHKTITNPSTDLLIISIYQTISGLPYLNPKCISNHDSFIKDASAKAIFDKKNNDFKFIPDYYMVANQSVDISNQDCVHDYQTFISHQN